MSPPSVLTIGNFDGVHLGHRAIVARAKQLAEQHHARTVALTFDPHPATVLAPNNVPKRLMSGERRVKTLREAGVDEVILLRPEPELLNLSAVQFIEKLKEQYRPVVFVEGEDFHFGKDRGGSINTLIELGPSLGFDVEVVQPVEVILHDQLQVVVRSSLIRWLLKLGRVADVRRCLGQDFALTAPIIKGEQRGRTIGIPTANLDMASLSEMTLPASGVYAGTASMTDDPDHIYAAAISVGNKPTFDGQGLVVEAHLLDFDSNVYDRRMTLRFSRWLRDQQPFSSVDALTAQLRRDIAATQRFIREESGERRSA